MGRLLLCTKLCAGVSRPFCILVGGLNMPNKNYPQNRDELEELVHRLTLSAETIRCYYAAGDDSRVWHEIQKLCAVLERGRDDD